MTGKPQKNDASCWRQVFELDLRSLALFRFLLGILLLVDLITRATNLTEHYTHLGVLPLAVARDLFVFSPLHTFGDTFWLQAVVFIVHGLFALGLTIGYRPRLMAFLCWLFTLSLLQRNPLLNHQGDALLCVLLFWAMFLPTGAHFAISRAKHAENSPLKERIFSLASTGYLLQFLLVFTAATAVKLQFAPWQNGEALALLMQVDAYAAPFGQWLKSYPKLLEGATFTWLVVEGLLPLLLLLPFFFGPLRLLVITLFILFQYSLKLSLLVGLLQPIHMVAILPFLPSWFWWKLQHSGHHMRRRQSRIYYDGACSFCIRSLHLLKTFMLLDGLALIPANKNPEAEKRLLEQNSWQFKDSAGAWHSGFQAFIEACRLSPIFDTLVYFFQWPPIKKLGDYLYGSVAKNRARLALLTAWLKPQPYSIHMTKPMVVALAVGLAIIASTHFSNLAKRPLFDESTSRWTKALHLQQDWSTFADVSSMPSGWINIFGRMADGNWVDLFLKRLPSWRKPRTMSLVFENNHWRMYWLSLLEPQSVSLRPLAGQYLCHRWNFFEEHPSTLHSLRMYYVDEPMELAANAPKEILQELLRFRCPYPE